MTDLPLRLSPAFDVSTIRAEISGHSERHYVYVLSHPDGSPFYVGKGVGGRAFFHDSEARNLPTLSHKLNIIRSIQRKGQAIGYVIDSYHHDEPLALAREREIIQSIGRHDLGRGPLSNQTDGGEGQSNPSEESRVRRAATLSGDASDPDRRAINQFFHSLGGGHESVPIKPLGSRKLVPLTPHPSPRRLSLRMAQAVIAAAAASGVLLAPGCRLPRCFSMADTNYAIENGVGRDMLKANVVRLVLGAESPAREVLELTEDGFRYILQTFGRERLIDLGILEPAAERHLNNS